MPKYINDDDQALVTLIDKVAKIINDNEPEVTSYQEFKRQKSKNVLILGNSNFVEPIKKLNTEANPRDAALEYENLVNNIFKSCTKEVSDGHYPDGESGALEPVFKTVKVTLKDSTKKLITEVCNEAITDLGLQEALGLAKPKSVAPAEVPKQPQQPDLELEARKSMLGELQKMSEDPNLGKTIGNKNADKFKEFVKELGNAHGQNDTVKFKKQTEELNNWCQDKINNPPKDNTPWEKVKRFCREAVNSITHYKEKKQEKFEGVQKTVKEGMSHVEKLEQQRSKGQSQNRGV